MKKIIFCFLLIAAALHSEAQKYTTAIGGRFGGGIGITAQQKLWNKTTAEFIYSEKLNSGESSMSLLLEHHNKLIGKRLNFYVGAGPHIGWVPGEETVKDKEIGMTGVAGLEMTIGRLNMSWDIKPALLLTSSDQNLKSSTAISLRYVFIKHKKKKVNLKFWEKKDKNKKKKKKKS